jgi:hypothetical protein
LRVAFRSNEAHFTESHYFPESAGLPASAPVHHIVNCCNLNHDGPWPSSHLQEVRDKTYRGQRFAAGYYLTDHFGPPAYLITRDRQLWIFASSFERIVWPFVVKLLLTLHAIEHSRLHLKAAAISFEGAATLLVGRGGTGKTVLLTQLCQNAGAQFLANTHVVVEEETVIPVLSALRVRNDRFFGPLIAARHLAPAIKLGEFLADPCADLGWQVGTAGPIKNICLVDYRGRDRTMIRSADPSILYDYMENFSLAVNIYGLREDVLDFLGSDVTRFSAEWSAMKHRLSSLIGRCRSYYVSCDATDPANLEQIVRMLR